MASDTTTQAPALSGLPQALLLADDSVAQVQAWLNRAATLHRKSDTSSKRLAELLKDPDGPAFAQGFVDRVLRPEDVRVAARTPSRHWPEATRILVLATCHPGKNGRFLCPHFPGNCCPHCPQGFPDDHWSPHY